MTWWRLIRFKLSPKLQVWLKYDAEHTVASIDAIVYPMEIHMRSRGAGEDVFSGGLHMLTSYEFAVAMALVGKGKSSLNFCDTQATAPRSRVLRGMSVEVASYVYTH